MGENKELQTILEAEIEAGDFSSGGEISSKLKDILRKIGVEGKVIRKIAIVTYELEMNVIIHSVGGRIQVGVSPQSVRITASDEGPGIKDVEKALQPGYSTASESIREMGFGAGMGLCNIKNYSDDLKINSEVGEGTKIAAYIYL